jgi:CRP/FNR family transcriptional regulator, cyclic AMP receptor protein
MSRENIAPRALNSGVLARLNRRERTALLSAGRPCTYDAGQTVIQQGERGDFALLLTAGAVTVTTASDVRDASRLLAVRVAGDLVGEKAVLGDGVRSATVTARTRLFARRIRRPDLLRLFTQYPRIAVVMVVMLGERLRAADEHHARRPSVRVRRVLSGLCDACGWEHPDQEVLRLGVTQEELAALAGVGARTVRVTIRQLKDEGLVSVRHGATLVLDRTRLRHSAGLPETGF